jgi:hypothetical protein
MSETTTKCVGCDEELKEDFQSYSELVNKTFCDGCRETDLEYPSQLISVHGGECQKVTFGDNFALDDDGEVPSWFTDLFDEWKGRNYEKTDAWRGYYDSIKQFKGVTEIVGGWTTGWADETTQRKVKFNTWCEEVSEGFHPTPYEIFFLAEPTSNVFSIAVTVFCKTKDFESVKEWLNSIDTPIEQLKEWVS